jgi:GNAT superfamily N-acetyltransferase
MVVIRRLSLPELTEEESKAVAPLLISSRVSFQESKNSQIAALFAFSEDKPIGTLIARYYPAINQSLLAHFFVLPEFRGKGIGTQLMTHLMSYLKEKKIRSIEIHFNASSETAGSLVELLKNTGWKPPSTLTMRYFFDLYLFNPHWLTHPPQLHPDEVLFPLADLTQDEIQQLRRWERENPLIQEVSPFEKNYELEKLNSLGLRCRGKLTGWVATHRVEKDVIRYSSLYLHSEHRGTGSAIALLAASIQKHKDQEPDVWGMTEINQMTTPLYWKKFVKKRLAIESVKTEEIKLSYAFDF